MVGVAAIRITIINDHRMGPVQTSVVDVVVEAIFGGRQNTFLESEKANRESVTETQEFAWRLKGVKAQCRMVVVGNLIILIITLSTNLW